MFELILICAFLSIVYYTWKLGISPMPSTKLAKKGIESLLPEEVNGTVYELGSGWGSLIPLLAKKYPKVVCYELSPVPFLISYFRRGGAQVNRKDFFKEDLKNAGLVVCYLYPDAMKKLNKKLAYELKPGTYIISNTFALPGFEPVKVIELTDIYKTRIYLYKV